jgi:hypothetical protein
MNETMISQIRNPQNCKYTCINGATTNPPKS